MADTDKRRLAVVECRTVTGDPDGTHLSVEGWHARLGEWLTSLALCGRSAEQGALPTGTAVTCADCESRRDSYERALAGRPTAEEEGIAAQRGKDIAFRIRAELVCGCGIYNRVNVRHEMTLAQAMKSPSWHDLCYWGEASAQIAEGACPGYETVPNICQCSCEGCKHNCDAHQEKP